MVQMINGHDIVSCRLAPKKNIIKKHRLLENIKRIIDDLNYDVDFIIVEGIHDEKALRYLGYDGPIIRLCSSGLIISRFIDKISAKFQGKRGAILVDFDKKGKQLNRQLIMKLSNRSVKIDQNIRRKLEDLISPEGIYAIEGISMLGKIYE
ncbi:MAG: hypothetical protein QW563_03445 [Candidatus Methanomethylicia archaeon]